MAHCIGAYGSLHVSYARPIEQVHRAAEPMRLPPPSPSAISRMEEAPLWLRWLEVDDAKLVWARADRTPWKAICWQFGISRATAHRRWQYGLSVIAWRLNRRRITAKRSRNFVVERVRRELSEQSARTSHRA